MPGNQFQAPVSPLQNTATQSYQGLLGQGATDAAGKTIQSGVATGNPLDLSSLFNQGQYSFQNFMAPSIKESLGANYGINFGTPQGEELGRAGAQSDIATKANAMQFLDAAKQRQLAYTQGYGGLTGAAGGLGAQQTGQQQQQLFGILQALQGGTGTLSGGTGFQMPLFAPSQGQQNLNSILALASVASLFM